MRLLCGGHAHDVDAADASSFEDLGGGALVVRDGDRGEIVHAVREGDAIHVFWRGAAYVLQEETEAYRAAHRHAPSGLEAPMPGKVIAVKVEPGQHVSKGQELLVVEAMKMENAIRAPRDGRVKAVSASVGDAVSPGTVLVEMDE
jgi:3-methylcrotonyl-CoA carboxylase alpha subunit